LDKVVVGSGEDFNMKQKQATSQAGETAKGKIFILPSLLTTFSLFSGFYAIVSAINGHFFHSAVAILIAGLFDGLDGRVARLTGTTSRFGMEYDSLSDLVAFGVAPALLAYQWSLESYGRYGWLAAFLYVATTALRLARFNSQDVHSEKSTFTGLPCPAAAGMVATFLLFYLFLKENGLGRYTDLLLYAKDFGMLILMYMLSYLMVSSLQYLSFKHPETSRARAFQVMVAMVLFVMVVATEPQVTLFVLGLVYIVSAPCSSAYRFLVQRGHTEKREKPA
jgi:CDP-diacylglycerol--serine O-phosphatidyltransferase